MLIAGSAGGRLNAGIHVRGAGSPTSRAALTLQQAYGLQVVSWGDREIQTDSPIAELFGVG